MGPESPMEITLRFIKAFTIEPDLTLQLTGTGVDIAMVLYDQGFRLDGSAMDISRDEYLALVKEALCLGQPFKIDMRVSSKHLTDSCSYFRVLIKGKFKEAADGADGARQIAVKEVAIRAFAMLMDILHVRSKSAADQQVYFSTLYELCTLVDMYELQDQTFAYTDRWFNATQTQYFHEDVHQRVFVAYVLRQKRLFKDATSYILRRSPSTSSLSSTPLPKEIIADLEDHRLTAVSRAAATLEEMMETYGTDREHHCLKRLAHCDALVYGCLVRKLKHFNIHPPSEAMRTYSVDVLIGMMKKLEIDTFCGVQDRESGWATAEGNKCGIQERVKAIIATLKRDTEGMDLPEK